MTLEAIGMCCSALCIAFGLVCRYLEFHGVGGGYR